MTDYQKAAIEAVKKERDRHYVTFPSYEQSLTCACGSNVEGHMYSELVAAAEPHLRKKWAAEVETLMPEMGSHINVTPYREGVADGINRVLRLLEGGGE